jgi:hypothetical protein
MKPQPRPTPLPPDRIDAALGAVAEWSSDPRCPVGCPVCGIGGLAITDQSARPHAEWYLLACASCGLRHTLHIPLGSLLRD